MKKTTLFILLLIAMQMLKSQTVLKPGDIAIVQVNFSQSSFDFVPLVDISAGTKISFTDFAWKSSLNDFDKTTQYDAVITFTAPSDIAKGTVIQSLNNAAFNNSFISFYSKNASNTYLKGENLIAFQKSIDATTFLTAFGWMRKNNFAANPYNSLAKVCDIPIGLSKDNFTVIQMDSIVWGQNATLQRDFRYNKYDGYTGNPSQIRQWTSISSNYDTFSGYYNNNAVPNFTVLEPDITSPSLLYVYPANNKLNVSTQGIGVLKFNELVVVQKSLTLTNITKNEIVNTYNTTDLVVINDSTIEFGLYPYLEKSSSYSILIPKDFVKDYSGNTWPSENTTYIFSTSANKSTIDCYFPSQSEIIIDPYISKAEAKDDIHWTTLSRLVDEYGRNYCNGYFSWTMSGLPMKYFMQSLVSSSTSTPDFPTNGIWNYGGQRLVVDLSNITHNITDIFSYVYDNNSAFFQKSYSGSSLVDIKVFSGYTGRNGHMHFDNENALKLDSVVFGGLEGRLISFKMDIIDKFPPTVNLGSQRVICDGDSVLLDAGLTLGALYNWNTSEVTQKIWAKTSGTYSVTVKNTLGQATDNVQVIVKPKITLSLPDTIYACVGDTVSLVAGTNPEYSYFWSPEAQTTPTIKVTKSGIYHVLVNNGFGGCFSTDSTRVIFKGAKARLFNYQGGSYGAADVKGQLYRKNSSEKYELYREMNMLDFVEFDSLTAGNYIFKMHFVGYSFVGQNPWMDTYHDGKTEWNKVTSFKLTCETDTMIGFLIANKPSFEFNGTAVISGKVNVIGHAFNSPVYRSKANINVDCNTQVILYNSAGDIIATTCPDANGNYSFTNLPAGSYTVGIEQTGFEVQSVFNATVSDGATISNADFIINQAEQTIVQAVSTAISNAKINDSFNLHLMPNPAMSTTMLDFDLSNDCKVTITISDLTGRVIQKDISVLSSGKNRIPLAVDKLSGVFIVKVSTVTGYSVARLIVR